MTNMHDIIWFDTIDSTNEEARRRISDIDNLSVLSAYEQTSGKGQRGNRWLSTRGENLMFSIVLKPEALEAGNQFVICEAASLSIVWLLAKYSINAEIKWPNDIYVDNKKICGILIENSLHGKHISSSIIGIGLNVNQRNFDVNLPNPTSMTLCKADNYNIVTLLEEFMDIFKETIAKAMDKGLREEYLSVLWRRGIPSRFIDYTSLPSGHHDGPMNINTETVSDSEEFTGIIRDLSPFGTLLVENEEGELREFAFKEIGYII